MKIGVLTSSRADFGIYLPLLRRLKGDDYFELEIIAFGTHTSKFHGNTVSQIFEEFDRVKEINTVLANDSTSAISTSYALTAMKFADFWSHNQYDLVFCLGDRYEMNAAVQAGIPFEIKYAHLHGGETTLGAIDNVYRHQITHASKLHFTATEKAAKMVANLTNSEKNIYCTGALSLEGIHNIKMPNFNEVRAAFNLPEGEFALVTFHPETVSPDKNEQFAAEMLKALRKLAADINIVVTMPNADTEGQIFRQKLKELKTEHSDKISLVENFGKANYFTAIKASAYLLGNTSSGIIEAASFGKYVVNVGDRQKGRERSENVIDVPFRSEPIIEAAHKVAGMREFEGGNIYYREDASDKIIEVLKKIHDA